MERRHAQPTFVDAFTQELGGPRSRAFFEQCDRLIPWSELAQAVSAIYKDSTEGRPHWPVVLLLKCVMLQKWFGLSDPQLEEQLRDRLSFRRFVGLGLEDDTPDETTICKFRARLRQAGHASTLFDRTVSHLRQRGLVLNEGTLVDATIVEAPRGHTNDEGEKTRDGCATFTKKHGRTYHGYKAHIATDTQGIITDYRFDTAGVHDSQHADELLAQETQAAYADSAYMNQTRKKQLESRGLFCGIIERRVRGQKELSKAQKQHNRFCAGIRAVVEHPFAWMKNSGYGWARYRGLIRNALDFALTAVAYNFKRSFSLVRLAG